ncbi:ABC transporter permease [Agaricicola taiwanensis]|uniref:ABC transporter permease n=1 Tax=Agaricicola taiwanensis TaxID=591372 RepID=A0A8J2VM23_9RHOB|nr:ABC transporter permease [Agaricicola taiwanensis]
MKGRRLSDLLTDIAEDESRERISVADLLFFMRDRAIGALMLIFALPNALPSIPGTSAILGAPLVFLAAQLALGWQPWLPKIIANRSMPRRDFATLIAKSRPWLARAEKLLRPRLTWLAYPPAEHAIGVICLIMSIVLVLPIPLGNMLPALAICLLALGLLERDGLWVIVGTLTGAGAIALVWGVLYALVKSAIFLLKNAVMT